MNQSQTISNNIKETFKVHTELVKNKPMSVPPYQYASHCLRNSHGEDKIITQSAYLHNWKSCINNSNLIALIQWEDLLLLIRDLFNVLVR